MKKPLPYRLEFGNPDHIKAVRNYEKEQERLAKWNCDCPADCTGACEGNGIKK